MTANAAIVPAGSNGDISVFASDDTDLVIDINGYFAPSLSYNAGLWLYNVTPCRVLDTRNPPASALSATRVVSVAGTCGVPGVAQAYVFNATVVPSGTLGYLSLWPQGLSQPLVSTLNALDGAVTSNMAIVPTNNGSINGSAPILRTWSWILPAILRHSAIRFRKYDYVSGIPLPYSRGSASRIETCPLSRDCNVRERYARHIQNTWAYL